MLRLAAIPGPALALATVATADVGETHSERSTGNEAVRFERPAEAGDVLLGFTAVAVGAMMVGLDGFGTV